MFFARRAEKKPFAHPPSSLQPRNPRKAYNRYRGGRAVPCSLGFRRLVAKPCVRASARGGGVACGCKIGRVVTFGAGW